MRAGSDRRPRNAGKEFSRLDERLGRPLEKFGCAAEPRVSYIGSLMPVKQFIKQSVRKVWRSTPESFRRNWLNLAYSETDRLQLGLPTLSGFLQNIRNNGFSPRTIVDVGANVGNWSRMAHFVFPQAQIFMLDADRENEGRLQAACADIGNKSEYAITLLGAQDKDAVTFYKMGFGSSVLPELTSFPRNQMTLAMETLDGFLERREFEQPVLLKLDVQGFELEVLRGALGTLRQAELVLLEVSLLPYNDGAPLFAEVVAFMGQNGFAAFDFCGQARRQTDHALFQTDMAFVREESPLRVARKFWLHEP